jgi:hypothetical protein
MSEILETSGDWLDLREPEDAVARSMDLARAAAALLTEGPVVVHDLGSGTGSMMRWLAPLLPGPQSWFLHDWSSLLTGQAIAQARPSDRDNAEISVFGRTGNLVDLSAEDLAGASLVTASALLDVMTSPEIHTIVGACIAARAPALFSLSVTGGVHFDPADECDAAFENAFNAHQLRDANGRRQLGRYGAPIACGLFAEAGWQVRKTTTQWRLNHHQSGLLGEWFCGWVEAAAEQDPQLRTEVDRYRGDRLAQIELGGLSVLVDHVDVLAWPSP